VLLSETARTVFGPGTDTAIRQEMQFLLNPKYSRTLVRTKPTVVIRVVLPKYELQEVTFHAKPKTVQRIVCRKIVDFFQR
jgi:hypothetical protein